MDIPTTTSNLTTSLAGIPDGTTITLEIIFRTQPGDDPSTVIKYPGDALFDFDPDQLLQVPGVPLDVSNALNGNALKITSVVTKNAAGDDLKVFYILTAVVNGNSKILSISPSSEVDGANAANQVENIFTIITFSA